MFTPKPGLAARIVAFSILLCCFVPVAFPGGPPLTVIQDVLYKADGSRFNGFVQISWNSFEAGDTSNIATQFRAVRIVDGNLSVKLVPTTNADPPATYKAVYNSDGKVQFEESWAVPPSSRPLRVRDVRISMPSNLDSGSAPMQESEIVGLVADLSARPTEGPGYATGRVLVTNSIGELEAVTGNLNDCVHVDGSSGPCGSSSSGSVPGYVDNEIPGGVVDGSNATFTLAGQPSPSTSLALYRNGMLQKAGFDFSLSGSTAIFVTAATPQPGDTLLASYRVAGSSSSLSAEMTAAPAVQTLCSSAGGSTTSASDTVLGTCVVPAGLLKAGDRVEIRFDYAHSGVQSGFTFTVKWGADTVLSRSAAAGESLISGRADAGAGASSTQLSAQSWGTSLAMAAVAGVATDPLDASLTIRFSGNLAQTGGDSLTLSNFTVMKYSR
jgi:hypothetical protein